MRNIKALSTAAIAGAILLGTAAPAHAQWGQQPNPGYCSSSTGCYMENGRPVQTTVGPDLTQREMDLQAQCNLRLAGTAFAGAGGVMSRNVFAILGAAFNGGAALQGPCKEFWDSTSRFRG